MSQEVPQIQFKAGDAVIFTKGEGQHEKKLPGTLEKPVEGSPGKWFVWVEEFGERTRYASSRIEPVTLPETSPVETTSAVAVFMGGSEWKEVPSGPENGQEQQVDDDPVADALIAAVDDGLKDAKPAEPELPDFILKPDVYDFEAMGEPPAYIVIGREQINGDRHYVSVHPGEDLPRFTPSVTTVKRETSPTPSHLERWRTDMAARYGATELVHEFVDDTAAYGTIMHSIFVDLVQGKLPELDSDKWEMYLRTKIALQDGRNPDLYWPIWGKALTKDPLGFIQWVQDYEVKFLMVENPLVGEKVAGQLDVFCEMNAAKYTEATPPDKRKRVLGIVDFKSGSIVDDHAFQLYLLLLILLENFPQFKGKEIRLYNWSRTDWKKEPTYKFVNWTDDVKAQAKVMAMQLDLYIERTKLNGNPAESLTRVFMGKPTLDARIPDLTNLRAYGEIYLDRVKQVRNIQKTKP